VVVLLDGVADLRRKIARQIIVLQQDPVFERLVSPLALAPARGLKNGIIGVR
jgi:hypothetical protein